MMRVLGRVCGGILALVVGFWFVTATGDLALAAGLYGTPGTYKVDSCVDTSNTRKDSDYDCYGEFTPDGGTDSDAVSVKLKDTGHDYPDGTEFDARQGIEPETIQRVGFWGVVGELWQVGICMAVLAGLGYQAVKPRGQSRRREDHRREPSRRQKVADRIGYAVVVAISVGILSWIAMAAEPTP
ncbi:hypothetical protein [Streptomyces cylindrosporus]|uniref:Uncharacterized protein n=1 Tax=Streptomyces cylindrosporus TaxID=2927583 RepID=A0ABS9YL58_9ACTN|nr:hypothetical protein [Streptomyces cylindrosporus]MCI3277890.1 hypothetical protein [Streptomyces cylindrosporus]